MENTWLYKKLNEFISEFSLFENKKYSNTLELIINLILLPLIGIVIILLYCFSILLIPLYLIKDFIDLYYYINAEKIEAERKAKEALKKHQKVEKYIDDYQKVLNAFQRNNTYCLKQFKIIEKKSNQIEDDYTRPGIPNTPFNIEQPVQLKYPTIRKRDIQKNVHKVITREFGSQSLQSLQSFDDSLKEYKNTLSRFTSITINNSYNTAKNDISKEYVELSIQQIKRENENHAEFIKKFLYNYNQHCDTFCLETGRRVCNSNRRRSAFDIYLITKYYYNDVTFKDVLFTLIDLVKSHHLYTSFCGDVHKYVYYTSYHSNHNRFDRNLEFSDKLIFLDLLNYNKLNVS